MKNLMQNALVLSLLTVMSSCSLGEWIAGMEPLGLRKAKDEGQASVQITVHNQEAREGFVRFRGNLREAGINESVIFASIGFYVEDDLIAGTESDFDGRFSLLIPFDAIPNPQNLKISVHYLGLYPVNITGLQYCSGDEIDINITMVPNVVLDNSFHHFWHYPPLYEPDNLSSGQTFTRDQIRRSPTRG